MVSFILKYFKIMHFYSRPKFKLRTNSHKLYAYLWLHPKAPPFSPIGISFSHSGMHTHTHIVNDTQILIISYKYLSFVFCKSSPPRHHDTERSSHIHISICVYSSCVHIFTPHISSSSLLVSRRVFCSCSSRISVAHHHIYIYTGFHN